MKRTVSIPTMIMVAVITLLLGFNISYLAVWAKFNASFGDLSDKQEQFSKFDEVYQYVKNNFVGKYDEDAVMDSAMKGYIEALGDRWSSYLTAEEYKYLTNTLNNRYTGVGVSVAYNTENKNLIVSYVYEGSSAHKAGIEIGNIITKVGNENVSDIGYYEAINKIRGEEGTKVSLTVKSEQNGIEKTFDLQRTTVKVNAVTSKIIENDIGYIKIDNFDANVDEMFEKCLNELLENNVTGIIFDVRDNGGGKDTVLLSMLDRLLAEGVIFSMKDKYGKLEEYVSDEIYLGLPMTVIVNKDSYSAAEFFAAALQELDKAVIVGEHTSGKGYAQSTIPLSDGSALYLSTRTYYTPKGQSLTGVGLSPDVEIYLENQSEDVQLNAAIDVIRNYQQYTDNIPEEKGTDDTAA